MKEKVEPHHFKDKSEYNSLVLSTWLAHRVKSSHLVLGTESS